MNHRGIVVAFVLFFIGAVCSACAALIGSSSSSTPTQVSTQQVLEHAFAIVEGVGDAVVRVKGYAILKAKAPEAIPLIDVNDDKLITLAEVKAAGRLLLEQPELVGGLLAAAYLLRKER